MKHIQLDFVQRVCRSNEGRVSSTKSSQEVEHVHPRIEYGAGSARSHCKPSPAVREPLRPQNMAQGIASGGGRHTLAGQAYGELSAHRARHESSHRLQSAPSRSQPREMGAAGCQLRAVDNADRVVPPRRGDAGVRHGRDHRASQWEEDIRQGVLSRRDTLPHREDLGAALAEPAPAKAGGEGDISTY